MSGYETTVGGWGGGRAPVQSTEALYLKCVKLNIFNYLLQLSQCLIRGLKMVKPYDLLFN